MITTADPALKGHKCRLFTRKQGNKTFAIYRYQWGDAECEFTLLSEVAESLVLEFHKLLWKKRLRITGAEDIKHKSRLTIGDVVVPFRVRTVTLEANQETHEMRREDRLMPGAEWLGVATSWADDKGASWQVYADPRDQAPFVIRSSWNTLPWKLHREYFQALAAERQVEIEKLSKEGTEAITKTVGVPENTDTFRENMVIHDRCQLKIKTLRAEINQIKEEIVHMEAHVTDWNKPPLLHQIPVHGATAVRNTTPIQFQDQDAQD